MPKLLLATKNPAKVREYWQLLQEIPYEIVTLAEEGIDQVVDETEATLKENAALKAKAYASLSHLLTLADDSGLEVDALGGEPGALSARFAGEGASDKERIDYLLARLLGIPWEQRTARFKCMIAIASLDGEVALCQGECQGIIAFEPKGDNGFGYDPIFYLPELGKTMAELSMDEKNEVSHRGQAVKKARRILEQRMA
ncbi:MAG: XTP/dITP diphosphatase [Dehalococcoidia bacterium]|nr:XTP/dITP diphosphatase [Dehalococcoidia bacterium]